MIILKKASYSETNYDIAFKYFESKFEKGKCRILDVGSGANPWAIEWITHVIDKFVDPSHIKNVSKNDIKVFNVDIDDPREWEIVLDDVEKNGKYDFVICSHTLEDVNNPKISCEMINKIGKSGYISMPWKYSEMISFENKNNFGLPYKGYHHHRWIYQIKNDVLIGYPKMNFHDYVDFNSNLPSNLKGIAFDKYEMVFLWEDSFDYEFVGPYQMLDNRVGPHRL